MQNVLSFLTNPSAEGRNISDFLASDTLDSGKKEASAELFQSFLSFWTNAAAGNNPENIPSTVLDLRFSAEANGVKKEGNFSLSSDDTPNLSVLSASVLNLLGTFSNELKGEGVDTSLLAEKAQEVFDDVLPDMDLNRLKAVLSKLKERYPSTIYSQDENHYGINMHVSDSLALGLEASFVSSALSATPEDPSPSIPQNTEENSGNPIDLATPSEKTEGNSMLFPEEAATAKPLSSSIEDTLALSRMHAYLSPSASALSVSPSSRNNSLASSAEKKSSPLESSSKVPQDALSQQHLLGSFSKINANNTEVQEKKTTSAMTEEASPTIDEKATLPPVKDSEAKSEKNLVRDEDKTITDKINSTKVTAKATDFENFFDNILTRKGQSDLKTPPLELVKDSPFSHNSTLRSGLENIVRFAKTDGSHKATLIVDPPALGRISVELTHGTSGIEASIKVSSEHIRQIIQDQLSQLRMSLSQQGVQLTQFSVDVQQDNSGQQQGFQQQQPRRALGGNDIPDDTPEDQATFRVDLNQGLLYWVA